MNEQLTKVLSALENLQGAYRELAESQMRDSHSSYASVYDVYNTMKECIAVERKANSLRRRYTAT